MIVGRRKFLAQLNESWISSPLSEEDGDKRRCDQGSLAQTNCFKRQEELLFCISSGENTEPELISAALVPNCSVLVIINVRVKYGLSSCVIVCVTQIGLSLCVCTRGRVFCFPRSLFVKVFHACRTEPLTCTCVYFYCVALFHHPLFFSNKVLNEVGVFS